MSNKTIHICAECKHSFVKKYIMYCELAKKQYYIHGNLCNKRCGATRTGDTCENFVPARKAEFCALCLRIQILSTVNGCSNIGRNSVRDARKDFNAGNIENALKSLEMLESKLKNTYTYRWWNFNNELKRFFAVLLKSVGIKI